MLRTKTADRVFCVTTAVMLLAATLLWGAVEPVRGDGSHTVGYESLLFDPGTVHTIDITMDGWDDFIANATAEEYTECNVVIDGEKYNHVASAPKETLLCPLFLRWVPPVIPSSSNSTISSMA